CARGNWDWYFDVW
nr:immunoglobulin heavy chain junction region [Mus musculus]NSM03652.1 immunoglobulin heavy chain junction region [Mus musculus]NSM03711.1 immunoglobulin heavy chain junction region [Mus musculus]NSM03735.1 immunoglobulin heavy chain junction region [Mus musculus]NSM03957.1 immunoglobulin heavy chain junction region [Mus musculus]